MPEAGENTTVVIRDARPDDLKSIADLLSAASLPTLGVAGHLHTFLVAEEGRRVIGAIGLEVYDDTALLRSAVVTPERRSTGIGSSLYNQLLQRARNLGVRRLVLLTNTAEEYFQRKGFRTVDQKTITGPVTGSVEFTGACPSHAVCMTYDLTAGSEHHNVRRNHEGTDPVKKRILIICTGNSCRSQMAEGFLKSFDPDLEVLSAGTYPASQVHKRAIAVMNEIGIDITRHYSKSVDQFLNEEFDFVITVCDSARESCPLFIGKVRNRLHIGFDDPSSVLGTEEQIMAEFRRVRDEIGKGLRAFYEKELRT